MEQQQQGTVFELENERDERIRELLMRAYNARSHAYCPYSNFRVGSAVLCADGTIFSGANVENASYGLSMCAERLTVMGAVGQGHLKFAAIAVCCDVKLRFKGPCGACRQVLAEFGMDWDMYLLNPEKQYIKVKMADLLPMAFTPQSLLLERDTPADS